MPALIKVRVRGIAFLLHQICAMFDSIARTSTTWQVAWEATDVDLRVKLTAKGLDSPVLLSGVLD